MTADRGMMRRICVGVAAVVLPLAGCSGNAGSVSGTVTYDGQLVGRGDITFWPADGVGAEKAAKIVDGRYSLDGLTPGLKRVQVIAVKAVPFARSSEEMARRAAENKSRGDGSGLIDPADVIPPDAEGNNATHVINVGRQVLNFDLKKPAKAASR